MAGNVRYLFFENSFIRQLNMVRYVKHSMLTRKLDKMTNVMISNFKGIKNLESYVKGNLKFFLMLPINFDIIQKAG
jgi:hypothetical protein